MSRPLADRPGITPTARMQALTYLWRNHRAALIAFAVALTLCLFFALRFVLHWIHWSDPAHRDVQIEGWMTPGFVAHSYRVPPKVIRDALPPPAVPDSPRKRTLEQIARESGLSVAQLTQQLMSAIEADRARHD